MKSSASVSQYSFAAGAMKTAGGTQIRVDPPGRSSGQFRTDKNLVVRPVNAAYQATGPGLETPRNGCRQGKFKEAAFTIKRAIG
ncbi:MAG TPA: hypothetical protein VK036_02580 [Wenzhouxiangella sp.]|nr:hypothetical protein [Wenzhouxiangella sp.]